jgi:hypothetical protein
VYIPTTYEKYIKEYKEITNEVIPITFHNENQEQFKKPSFNNMKSNSQKLLHTSLLKFEDFKNSLKTAYSLDSSNLMIDNKVINFRDKENELFNNTHPEQVGQVFENFYLESTIDMFKEIFNNMNK